MATRNAYNSGAVATGVRHAISTPGLAYLHDLGHRPRHPGQRLPHRVAIPNGQPFLTRAGSFITDAATGNLVNAGGYTLLGYPLDDGNPNATLNGVGNLVPINMTDKNLQAVPSTAGDVHGQPAGQRAARRPATRPPTTS